MNKIRYSSILLVLFCFGVLVGVVGDRKVAYSPPPSQPFPVVAGTPGNPVIGEAWYNNGTVYLKTGSGVVVLSSTSPSGWQLDDLVSGGTVGSASCGLNGLFNHSAHAAIIVVVYSTQNLPSSVQYTSEMTLNLLASFDGTTSGSPVNQPSVAIYAGTAATTNAAANFNAIFASAQGTCLIIAMSWLFPGHTAFTFNNYAIGGHPWQGATSLQVTMGSDTNADRLALFFASIYGQGGQPTASNDASLTVLQTLGNYQASPANSISAQVAYLVNNGALTETMTANTSLANGVLYPFIGVDPA